MSRAPELNTPAKESSSSVIKVVVLVLENNQGDILLTQRKKHQHLAGFWEFPGGKIDMGESAIEALKRESIEELNYAITTPKQILQIHHDYSSLTVELLVFHEINPDPKVCAAENQAMKWVNKTDLTQYQLPEANQSIVDYLQTQTN